MAVETYHRISTASTNAVSVVASPAVLTAYVFGNLEQASMLYLKLYDKASAPTVGTDVPKLTFGIPPLSAAHVSIDSPLTFTLGIALAMTTGAADANATAVAADKFVANLAYE